MSPPPSQSLRGGRQTSFSSQGSCFQKWRACPDMLLNEFIPSNTLAWHTMCRRYTRNASEVLRCVWHGTDEGWQTNGPSNSRQCAGGPSTRHPGRVWEGPRKVGVRRTGIANSTSHGARPVHLIISMIKWIRTSRLTIQNSLY